MTLIKNKKDLFILGGFSMLAKFLFIFLIAQGTIANAAPAPESFADLAERLLPSVVNISSTQKVKEQPEIQTRRGNPFGGMPQFPDGHPFNDFFDDFLALNLILCRHKVNAAKSHNHPWDQGLFWTKKKDWSSQIIT